MLVLACGAKLRYSARDMSHSHPPHSHDHCAALPLAERLREATALCQTRGVRLTGQRALVLEVLIEAKRALGAYDLIDLVAARAAKRIAPITIYRALDFLVENDLVHRIESRNAFLACPGGHGAHPQAVFMICETCGAVSESVSPQLESDLAALALKHGFRPSSRVIELTGCCGTCADILAQPLMSR